jgi:hypothetical protein
MCAGNDITTTTFVVTGRSYDPLAKEAVCCFPSQASICRLDGGLTNGSRDLIMLVWND